MKLNSKEIKNNILTASLNLDIKELEAVLNEERNTLFSNNFTNRLNQITEKYNKYNDTSDITVLNELIDSSHIGLNKQIKKLLELDRIPFWTQVEVLEKNDEEYKLEFKSWLIPEIKMPDLNLFLTTPEAFRTNPNAVIGKAYTYFYDNIDFEIPDFVLKSFEKMIANAGEGKLITDPLLIDIGVFSGFNGPIPTNSDNVIEDISIRLIKTICMIIEDSKQLGLTEDLNKAYQYAQSFIQLSKAKFRNQMITEEDILLLPNSFVLTVMLEDILNYVLSYALKHS